MTQQQTSSIIAFDFGERRIGVAIASSVARLPQPHGTIPQTKDTFESIKNLIKEHNIQTIIVGLPRGLNGQETQQTGQARAFASQLKDMLGLPVYLQDEALTSKQAETELHQKRTRYNKEAVDALAATYILNDFLAEHKE